MRTDMFSRPLFHFLLIAVLGLLVYSNTFNASFHFDDGISIIRNPLIKDFSYFLDPEKVERKAEESMLTKGVQRYFRTRYVGNLSLWANYRLHGLDVRGYHAVNLALHIINAILLCLLVRLTFRTPAMRGCTLDAGRVALFAGLLFVAHPLQTEAVTYVLSRFVLLVSMFYLLSLALYVKWRLTPLSFLPKQESIRSRWIPGAFRPGRSRPASAGMTGSFLLYLLSLLSCVLAMKTKENAFTLPVAVALYEIIFFREGVKKRVVYLVPFLLTMLIIPLTYLDVHSGAGGIASALEGATRLELSMPRPDYLYTQFTVIVSYIRLLLFPANQNFDHDPMAYHSFFDPPVFLSVLLVLSMLGFGIYLYYRSRVTDHGSEFGGVTHHASRLCAFGIFWFFLALSVESSVLPIGEIMVEYRVYLPAAGFLTSVVVLVFSGSHSRRVVVPAMLMLVLGFSAAAYARNTVWKTEISLWEDVVRKSPLKARGHYNLGLNYRDAGRLDEAIEKFRLTIERFPSYRDAYNELGAAYAINGEPGKAVLVFKAVIERWPDFVYAHYNIGRIYHDDGEIDLAERHYRRTIELFPPHDRAYKNLGDVYLKKGMSGRAIEHYEEALRLNPEYVQARVKLEELLNSEPGGF